MGFEFFFYFFHNFLVQVEFKRNSGLKFFFSFLANLIPFWLKILLESSFLFLFFFVFFFYFFGNILARGEYERNSGLNFFFFSFAGYLFPFWLEIIPEGGFLIFSIFLLFFSKFSCPGRVWTEFGTKIFFALSWPISSRFD